MVTFGISSTVCASFTLIACTRERRSGGCERTSACVRTDRLGVGGIGCCGRFFVADFAVRTLTVVSLLVLRRLHDVTSDEVRCIVRLRDQIPHLRRVRLMMPVFLRIPKECQPWCGCTAGKYARRFRTHLELVADLLSRRSERKVIRAECCNAHTGRQTAVGMPRANRQFVASFEIPHSVRCNRSRRHLARARVFRCGRASVGTHLQRPSARACGTPRWRFASSATPSFLTLSASLSSLDSVGVPQNVVRGKGGGDRGGSLRNTAPYATRHHDI